MSKVAIQGNASGTGTLTIAAPNTNTNRTLTLPDEAGTVLTTVSELTAGNLTGSVPTSAMPSGSVVQAGFNYYGGSAVTINNTSTSGQAAVTLSRKLTNSKFLVISQALIHRPGTGGFHYLGFAYSGAGSGTTWLPIKDATSWTTHSLHDLNTYSGNAGDSVTFLSANYNTANQNDSFSNNVLIVMEIAP